MLVIRDLVKTYPSGVQALRGVSLDLSPGVFGLLGPNGSGKTTLMKIVATLMDPDSGTIQMNGVDLLTRKDQTRRMLGYLPQDLVFIPPSPPGNSSTISQNSRASSIRQSVTLC